MNTCVCFCFYVNVYFKRYGNPKTWIYAHFLCSLNACARNELLLSVPNDPRRVIVQKLAVLVDGRADVEIDLTGGWYINLA